MLEHGCPNEEKCHAGGGVGMLGRKYGLASDQILSLDMVDANGNMITANAQNNSDLLFASQGTPLTLMESFLPWQGVGTGASLTMPPGLLKLKEIRDETQSQLDSKRLDMAWYEHCKAVVNQY